MSRCRTVEGLIAASLYEVLTPDEQRTLDEHLEACSACREAFQAMSAMVAVIPGEQPVFGGDLLPVLREELRRRPGRVRVFGWWGFATAASAVVLMAAFAAYTMRVPDVLTPSYETASVASPLVEAMATASQRIDDYNYNGAYQVLERAVSEYSDDPLAGEAQMLMADLAYNELYRYADAYRDYDTLRVKYNDVFASTPANGERFALLAEAQQVSFASLEALEAARRAGSDSFEQLEAVVARYPSQMVASLAAEEMGRIVAQDLGEASGGPADVLAMEQARDRCKDPVAVARLNLELAEVYARDLKDGAQACTLFKEVEESGNTTLAQLAHDTAARLGVECGS